jgi:methyltransferase (TIGR00027 family)
MHAERPSTTATMIALGLLAVHARRNAGSALTPEDAELLRGALRDMGGVRRVAGALAVRTSLTSLARVVEWCLAPGTAQHFSRRKQHIESLARECITSGVRRVVVLAAGLDLLALHLARDTDLDLVEVDHPATQPAKRALLARAGSAAARIRLVGADLADARWTNLLTPVLEPMRPTLFVAEGLSMYLTTEQWGGLLGTLASLPGASRLVFTFLGLDARDRAGLASQRGFLPTILSRLHEPFRWGETPDAIGPFVARHGWSLDTLLGAESLPVPFAGEYIARCTLAAPSSTP